MMNSRILCLALLAGSLSTGSAAFAQVAPSSPAPASAEASPAPEIAPHHRRPNRMVAALEALDLSDDQKAKIKDIMTAYRSSRDSATPETRKQMRDQVEGVLTPPQREQFESRMKHRPAPVASPAS